MSEDHLELERRLLVNLLGPPDRHWSQQVIWGQHASRSSKEPLRRLLIIAGDSWYNDGSLYAGTYQGPGEKRNGWVIHYDSLDFLWPPVTFEEILKIITDADWRREHGFPKLDDVQDHD